MKNLWIPLYRSGDNISRDYKTPKNTLDADFSEFPLWNVEPGDEVEYAYIDEDGECDSGIVLDIIRNRFGAPVCFKIAYLDDTDGEAVWNYDYIPCYRVLFYEKYGDITRSLERIGYKYIEEGFDAEGEKISYWKNEETGDVILW